MRSWLRQLRPDHWTKNLLVAAPAFFAGRIAEAQLALRLLGAFWSLCLCASGLYAVNDLCDLRLDRVHPRKRRRPLASGAIAPRAASVCGGALILAGLSLALCLGGRCPALVACYVALGLAYSLGLKGLAPLDVLALATGYLLRVLVGGAATAIEVSPWLFMSVFLLALFVCLGKRRAEMRLPDPELQRPVLAVYRPEYLDLALALAGGGALVVYALYAVERGGGLVYTVLPAAWGVLRYLQLLVEGRGEDPLGCLLGDGQLRLATALFLGGIAWEVYG